MLWIPPLVNNSPFSVATEEFNVVNFGEKHGAECTVMGTCIESTTLYRKEREFAGMEYKNRGHVTYVTLWLSSWISNVSQNSIKTKLQIGKFSTL